MICGYCVIAHRNVRVVVAPAALWAHFVWPKTDRVSGGREKQTTLQLRMKGEERRSRRRRRERGRKGERERERYLDVDLMNLGVGLLNHLRLKTKREARV
jgi:hypothetical protein